MSDFECSECGNDDFVYCYIVASNCVKQYRRVCTKCGLKDSAAHNIKYSVVAKCGYKPKEYTGAFREKYLAQKRLYDYQLYSNERILVDAEYNNHFEYSPECLENGFSNNAVIAIHNNVYYLYCTKCKTKITKLSDNFVDYSKYNIEDEDKQTVYYDLANNIIELISHPELVHHIPKNLIAEYEEYIKSPQWQKKKNIRLSLDNGQCVLCFTTHNLQTHHVTYERLFNEEPRDLMTVCKDCHETIHGRKFE